MTDNQRIADINNAREIIHRYLSTIGRKGGLTISERKAKSSRENGKKGGRPRTKPRP